MGERNKVTALYFGLGMQRETKRTEIIQKHLDEMNDDGWRLIHADGPGFSIPNTRRYYWESVAPSSEADQ